MAKGPTAGGLRQQDRILAELARIYLDYGPPPTWKDICAILEMSDGSLALHLRGLRERGFVHPDHLWITRAGIEHIQPTL